MTRARVAVAAGGLLLAAQGAAGHAGPPFPVLVDHAAGPYVVSVWTDPDATDDGTAAGRFWVIVTRPGGEAPPAGTTVSLALRPLDRPGHGPEPSASAAPDPRAPRRHFAALCLDHEGRWEIAATLAGPLGFASVSAQVEATYALRPPLSLVPLFLLPFALVGLLWLKALRVRRYAGAPPRRPRPE